MLLLLFLMVGVLLNPVFNLFFRAVPTLILPSPAKPMILPVSVMGPNSLGTVQVVSNQVKSFDLPLIH